MKQSRGKFIVFEGIDGAGKTTQIGLLEQYLKTKGIPAVTTAEPTDLPEGKLLRRALAGEFPTTPSELAALFTADRIAHNLDPEKGIRRMLEDGKTVLSDRYYYSTLAYQGALTDRDWAMSLNLSCPDILRPDLCIFLDLTPKESMERIARGRTTREIFETEEQLTRIRESFRSVFDRLVPLGENIAILHASGTPEEIAGLIREEVAKIL